MPKEEALGAILSDLKSIKGMKCHKSFLILLFVLISFVVAEKSKATINYVASSSNDYDTTINIPGTDGHFAIVQRLNWAANPEYNPNLNIAKIGLKTFGSQFANIKIIKIWKPTNYDSDYYLNSLHTQLYYNTWNNSPENVLYSAATSSYSIGGDIYLWFIPDEPIKLNSYGYDSNITYGTSTITGSYWDYYLVASTTATDGWLPLSDDCVETETRSLTPEGNTCALMIRDVNEEVIDWKDSQQASTTPLAAIYQFYSSDDPNDQGTTTILLNNDWDITYVPDDNGQDDFFINNDCANYRGNDTGEICVRENNICKKGQSCQIPYSYRSVHMGKKYYILDADCYFNGGAGYIWDDCLLQEGWLDYTQNGYGGVLTMASSTFADIGVQHWAMLIPKNGYYYEGVNPSLYFGSNFWTITNELSGYDTCTIEMCGETNICSSLPEPGGYFDQASYSIACAGRKLVCWSVCPSLESQRYLDNGYAQIKGGFPFNTISTSTNILGSSTMFVSTSGSLPLPFYNKDTGGFDSIGNMVDKDKWENSPFYSITNTFYGMLQYIIYGFTFIYIVRRLFGQSTDMLDMRKDQMAQENRNRNYQMNKNYNARERKALKDIGYYD